MPLSYSGLERVKDNYSIDYINLILKQPSHKNSSLQIRLIPGAHRVVYELFN